MVSGRFGALRGDSWLGRVVGRFLGSRFYGPMREFTRRGALSFWRGANSTGCGLRFRCRMRESRGGVRSHYGAVRILSGLGRGFVALLEQGKRKGKRKGKKKEKGKERRGKGKGKERERKWTKKR